MQRWPSIVAMPPVSPSPAPSQDRISDSEAAEILRLKRKLAATHQELDEARGSRLKKIPWVYWSTFHCRTEYYPIGQLWQWDVESDA